MDAIIRQAVGVSSVTGEGMDDFLAAVQEARQEYLDDYRPELERLAKERDAKRETSKKEQLARLMKDMKVGSKRSAHDSKTANSASRSTEELSRPIDEEYEGDGQIIEPVSTLVTLMYWRWPLGPSKCCAASAGHSYLHSRICIHGDVNLPAGPDQSFPHSRIVAFAT